METTKKDPKKETSDNLALNILLGTEEILEREITEFGTGAHVIVPQKHIGKKVKVLILK
jgi:putative transposon-encoded protein